MSTQADAKGSIREGDYPLIRFQMARPDGALLTRSDVAGIELQVFDRLTSLRDPVDVVSLVVSDVLFDTPVIDASWDSDTVGANFIHTYLDAASTLKGGRTYAFEYTVWRTNGARPVWRADVSVLTVSRI